MKLNRSLKIAAFLLLALVSFAAGQDQEATIINPDSTYALMTLNGDERGGANFDPVGSIIIGFGSGFFLGPFGLPIALGLGQAQSINPPRTYYVTRRAASVAYEKAYLDAVKKKRAEVITNGNRIGTLFFPYGLALLTLITHFPSIIAGGVGGGL